MLAEVLSLVERRKIILDFDALLNKLDVSQTLRPWPFDYSVLKLMPSLPGHELHDWIIMTTARLLHAKILTKDRAIRASKLVECLWE